MSLKIVEELRERTRERVETLRKRFLGESGGILRAGSLCSCPLGSGSVVDNILKAIEQRPKIIPTVLERIRELEFGARAKGTPQPTTTTEVTRATITAPTAPTVTEKKILRG